MVNWFVQTVRISARFSIQSIWTLKFISPNIYMYTFVCWYKHSPDRWSNWSFQLLLVNPVNHAEWFRHFTQRWCQGFVRDTKSTVCCDWICFGPRIRNMSADIARMWLWFCIYTARWYAAQLYHRWTLWEIYKTT